MKTKTFSLLFFFAFNFFFSQNTFAQIVTVTPKKVIYKRQKPFTEYKKNFVVIYPIIKGLNSDMNKKVEVAISYQKIFDFNLKEETNEIQWLEEASFKVNYNKNGILGISLSMSGSGAYPSIYEKAVVVNLKTGDRIEPPDAFVKLGELAALCKKAQQAEIKKSLVEIKKENPDEENPQSLFENSDFTVKNLDEFSVSDKGVTFLYDYSFPHVILALQPEGKYFFSWVRLKPFVKRDGVFAKFIR
ncbi:MAG: hypothetical protein LC768_03395 [Acidobacteria bacterium]|nr:hypothetical protein [Acidobacteriota bacterium]MCA1637373.1 hypothetical protein [Acidobacteriota bacterium]